MTDIETINNAAAYHKNKPIINPAQIVPEKITWNPIGAEWKNRISNNWWAVNYKKDPLESLDKEKTLHIQKVLKLRDLLLSFGGEEACMPFTEEDIDKLLSRGQFWYGDKITMMKGEPGQCHRNTCDLWDANKDKVFIATGYALSADSMWRQHSWGVHCKKRINRIAETTTPRVAYFGFVMTNEEAEDFFMDNL